MNNTFTVSPFFPRSKRVAIRFAAFAIVLIISNHAAFAQWKQVTGFSNSLGNNNVDDVAGFLVYGNNLLADARCASNQTGATSDSLFLSSDNGQTWSSFAPNGGVPLVAFQTNAGYALIGSANLSPATGNKTVLCYSRDQGQTWFADTTGWPDTNAFAAALISFNGKIYMSCGGSGIFQQTAPGAPWTPDTVGMTISYQGVVYPIGVNKLVSSGNNLIAASAGFGMYVSTNNGASWSSANSGLSYLDSNNGWAPAWAFANSGSSLYALFAHDSTDNTYDCYLTTNNGQSWTLKNSTPQTWSNVTPQLAAFGQNLFAATDSGFYVSTNSGTTWTQWNAGLPTANGPYVNAVQVSGGYVMVSTFENGVWIRKLSDLGLSAVTPIAGSDAGLKLAISGNPASGSGVTITYTMSDAGPTQVSVMDELGRTVRVLQNGMALSGQNVLTLDPLSFAPGSYFVRLSSNGESVTEKLVITR